jgi:hypothetical protein
MTAGIDPTIFEDPELLRIVRPKLLALLSDMGIAPVVDEGTGDIMVPIAAIAAALGMTEGDALAAAGPDGARVVPVDRLRPLQ